VNATERCLRLLVRPLAMRLPAWLPAENLLSLALELVACFLIGIAVRTRVGGIVRHWMDRALFERLPGYGLFRSLTQRLAGKGRENVWKPALVEIEDALVPVPTPLAGAVYILSRERLALDWMCILGHQEVHPLDVSFTQAIGSISSLGIRLEAVGGGDESGGNCEICTACS